MNSLECSDIINVCFRKCILPSLEFFGSSWLPQISCYFSPWVLVPWSIGHLGWGSEARSILVNIQREENSVSQAPLGAGIFWPLSFLSLLRTKQNWEKALPLGCNQPSPGFKRESTEKRKPETSLIPPTKQDWASLISPKDTCPHGLPCCSWLPREGKLIF